jgi:hypothetical protein
MAACSFPNLLDCEEVAQLLRLKAQTLAVWRCRRMVNLPFIRAGRKILYKESDVLAFVDAGGQPRKTKAVAV